MPEQTALSGRELARSRRAMLAQGGKSGAAQAVRPGLPAALRPAERSAPSAPAAPSAQTDRGLVQGALSGRELSRARRAMLAQGGKSGAAQAVRPGLPAAPRPAERSASPAPVAAQPSRDASPAAEAPAVETALDSLCEIVEQDPLALGATGSDVRRICRDRRRALATQGKSALPAKPGMQARPSNGRAASGGSAAVNGDGRLIARERRAEMSRIGRGNAPPARPVRERPKGAAPVKVEVGTTLSGMAVTGTQVERKPQITGGESGTCRVVTGTEYIGAEQFDTFCGTRPEPAGARVGVTSTGSGNRVTTNAPIGRASRVTGDESGDCKTVTGTEYLGGEHFAEFCESKGLLNRPEKVVMGATARKGLPVTGSDEARLSRVTGFEPGATRNITGSQYSDAGVARLTINGPSKVALTHTLAGRPVTGTEVGRSVKVTGEEAGGCRLISGTEYLSTEQFQSICNTKADPSPAKVGVDKSRGGQRITGNLVDASEKVTGNEPGSNQRVTGAQYGSPAVRRDGVEKVAAMRTLAGRAMTGTMVGRGPKLTGDEHGGCQPVTGTEYYGRESFDAYCSGTPAPAAAKVGLSQTGRGLVLSGTMLERTERVTGNEPGSTLPVSGTPYAGPPQAVHCDGACDARPVAVMAGNRMPPRRSRFLAPADRPMPQPLAPVVIEERRPAGFSISSPARYAQETRKRVTGSAYGGSSTITGPATMADGLVSGTPEFRYRDDMGGQRAVQAVPASAQPAAAPVQAAAAVEEVAPPSRITGDGREAGIRITGDDWTRSGRVTGTEGRWAQSRNPSLRGEVRSMAVSARTNKDLERAEVPPAKVTGASGNSASGAMITVSGGARG